MKVAVIGTGFGERVVAGVWRRLGCEVTSVLSPRDAAGIERACASNVDLVSIHSPPFLHHAHVMTALDHERNVLCDKPFGADAREARAMRDRAKALGVLHFLNFEFRRHPGREKAKALLDAGAIGELRHINWSFIGNGLRPQAYRWLFSRDRAGGWIGAFGSHAIDSMRHFFGQEIVACGGIARTEVGERADRTGARRLCDAEDAFTAWFRLEGGGTVSLDTAFSSAVALPHRIHLLGSVGTITIEEDMDVVLQRPGQEPKRFDGDRLGEDPHEPGLIPWFAAVRDAVGEGRQIAPNFDDGWAVAEVMQLLRHSIDTTQLAAAVD